MLNLLKQLVETESPSSDKSAVDRVGAIVAAECRKLGADVKVIQNMETGDHILAKFALSAVEAQPLLLLCHMDTVFPLGILEKMPFYEKDGKIYGPGVSDMKSGIVITLEAIRSTLSTGKSATHPIIALFTSDEEIGSYTSRALIESLARESAMVFVMESALVDGSIKTWRKGVGDFIVKVKGRAAHAGGDHHKGINAIEEMAHQVLAIQKLTDYKTGTTLNVGQIRGGFATNVVPDECTVELDLRVLQPGEAERIESALKNLKPVLDGTSLEVTGELNRPPLPYNEINQAAFKKAYEIAKSIGMELKAGGSGGGSDGNFVAPLGVPVLDGLGAVGEGLHSEREYIFANSLEERAKLLAALIQNW
ncbi:MAG: M20 family metallopeptidase [Anaerolineales bacterium]|nr:M20 family metallopeptidase [Anaerolineales bacterium]